MAISIDTAVLRRRNTVRALAAIVAANAVIFVALRILAIISSELAGGIISVLSLPSSPGSLSSCPWSPVTYMFTQYDALHVILNMLWFTWFGLILADAGARARFIVMTYIAGGLAAAAGYLILSPGPGAFLIGSSGAVMAIVAAAATATPRTRLDLPLLRSVSVATAAIAIAVIYAVGIAIGVGGSHVAHICGALAGIAAGVVLRRISSITATVRGREPSAGPGAAPILDKVRSSGFEALTAEERARLISASREADQSVK